MGTDPSSSRIAAAFVLLLATIPGQVSGQNPLRETPDHAVRVSYEWGDRRQLGEASIDFGVTDWLALVGLGHRLTDDRLHNLHSAPWDHSGLGFGVGARAAGGAEPIWFFVQGDIGGFMYSYVSTMGLSLSIRGGVAVRISGPLSVEAALKYRRGPGHSLGPEDRFETAVLGVSVDLD